MNTPIDELMIAAQSGNRYAQCDLGTCYELGDGVPVNYSEAIRWYGISASQGFADAQRHLGHMYYDGLGTQQNHIEAFKWFREASQQGDPYADNYLGMMYLYGQGIQKDDGAAFNYFMRAAEKGVTEAKANIGYMYDTGTGVPQNDEAAFHWYLEAASDGDAPSMRAVANRYRHGVGVDQDTRMANIWDENYRRVTGGKIMPPKKKPDYKKLAMIAAALICIVALIAVRPWDHHRDPVIDDGGKDTKTEVTDDSTNNDSIAEKDSLTDGPVYDDSTTVHDSPSTGDSGTEEDMDVYQAYAQVLRDYEYEINDYIWQSDEKKLTQEDYERGTQDKRIAFYDLNGDGTPEMLFMSAENEYTAVLHIYTYIDGYASESSYVCSYSSDYPEYPFRDLQVAGGTYYMIYTGKDKGVFHIAYTNSDDFVAYGNDEMYMDSDGEVYETAGIYNIYNDWDPDNKYDDYYIDGRYASNDEGMNAFREAGEDYGTLLMFSGRLDDLKVGKHLDTDTPVAMSYDEAMSYLGY